jgi:translation initiation factor 3 subunit I
MLPYILSIHTRPLTHIKCNLDGDFFLSCGKDGEVNLCRTDTGVRVGTYQPASGEKAGALYAVDVTFDSQYVVCGGADGKLVFYTFDGEQHSVINQGGIVKYVEFNQKPGEQTMVVSCNDKFKSEKDGAIPNRIMIWKYTPSAKKLCQIDELLQMKATKVKWGPFDKTVVSIDEEGSVSVWDVANFSQPFLAKKLDAHTQACTSLNFSLDRTLMITCSKDTTAKLWSMDTYECVKTYKTDRPLNDVAISPTFASPNGKKHILMCGGQDAKDVTTTAGKEGKFESVLYHMVYEEELGQIKGSFGPVNAIAWLNDGSGFIIGSEDGYVRLYHWDADYFTSKKLE